MPLLARILLCAMLSSLWPILSSAQSVDYQKAMDDIMDNHLSDYPEPTIRALDRLFAGTEIDSLPAETQFLYHYYYAGCLVENAPDAAIDHLTQARKIAYLDREVGIRNVLTLDAEISLAELYVSKGTDASKAVGMFLYNEIITIGVSLLENPYVSELVVLSLIELAKLGVKVWLDDEWVKKIWIQVRDLVMEINDPTFYSYYVLGVLKYYCDHGEYDAALTFMEDAKNKGILNADYASVFQHISDVKRLFRQNNELTRTKGVNSIEYWSNRLDIAKLLFILCSEDISIELLEEVEQGLIENNLTESYEYAQVLYLLSESNFNQPIIAEIYFEKQVNLLETMPQYFVFTSDTEVFNSLAVCQMKQGKYTTAQVNYQKALTCLERDKEYSAQSSYKNLQAIIYHNLGRNLYFLGEFQESKDYFTKSIALQEETSGSAMQKTIVYMSETMNQICLN